MSVLDVISKFSLDMTPLNAIPFSQKQKKTE